jgi:hypothetical protein
MTTEPVSLRTVVVSWLSISLRLRYGIAKPSVWLCRKAYKLRQFNGFRSDYPLNLSCFGFAYWSVREYLHVPWFFVALPVTVCILHELSRSWLRPPVNIAGYIWNHLGARLLIRNRWGSSSSRGRPLATLFPAEYSGAFFSPSHPRRVAAREFCLNLNRKCWLNLNTVASFAGT